MVRHFVSSLATLICSVVLVVGSPAIAASANQGSADCAAERAALSAVQQQIDAHNARPNVFEVPRQAVQAAAYDAEAAEQNAAAASTQSALQTCIQKALTRDIALEELADKWPNSPVPKESSAGKLQQLEVGIKKIPPNWQAPPRVPGKRWEVNQNSPVRPIYNALRANNPGRSIGDVTLRGVPRPRIGDPDPAYPGSTIGRRGKGPNVSPDHIVSMAEMVQMPGFTRLSPENMYAVTRAPLNLQWMSKPANEAKSSKVVAEMRRADPAWRASQADLQNQVRTQLQDIINRLLSSQG